MMEEKVGIFSTMVNIFKDNIKNINDERGTQANL